VTPPGADWLLDNFEWVLAAGGVLALMFLARPYAGLANSAT